MSAVKTVDEKYVVCHNYVVRQNVGRQADRQGREHRQTGRGGNTGR